MRPIATILVLLLVAVAVVAQAGGAGGAGGDGGDGGGRGDGGDGGGDARSPEVVRLLDERVAGARARHEEQPEDAGATLELAKALHFRGLAGDADATAAAAALLERLHDADAAAPLPAAYLGSVRLVQASRAVLPWTKGRLAKRGGALLDAAVAAAPQSLEVRYVRGVSTVGLPPSFGVLEQARADLAAVAAQLPAAADEGRLEPWLAASTLLHHGRQLQHTGDPAAAAAAWRRAVTHWPDTPAGLEAQALVDR